MDFSGFLKDVTADGYPVGHVVEAVCACGGRTFGVEVGDEGECARRVCVACGEGAFIGDSDEYWDEVEPDGCACPCGGEVFELAVGFSLLPDGEVRWVTVALRCVADGEFGVYADWKIDYLPSRQLLTRV